MKTNSTKSILTILLLVLTLQVGCFIGLPSDEAPVRPITNMMTQYKYKPFRQSPLFEDGNSMRLPIQGTVARGSLSMPKEMREGKDENDALIKTTPIPMTLENVKRGQERYQIYCQHCHGAVGNGKGMISNYGMMPPTYHDERLRNESDGHFFNVMTNGIRTMPSLKHIVSTKDRWAIVLYIRALQKSQYAKVGDVPEEKLKEIKN